MEITKFLNYHHSATSTENVAAKNIINKFTATDFLFNGHGLPVLHKDRPNPHKKH